MSYEHYKTEASRFMNEHTTLVSAAAATSGALLLYYLLRRRPALTFPVSVDDQSQELEAFVRASKLAPDGTCVRYYYEDAKTCYEAFVRGMRVSDNGPCLGTRSGPNLEYEWLSYREVYSRAQAFGSACIDTGLKPQNDTFVGIFASNCSEWVITEQACNMYSMVVVPLYDTLGAEACAYIINQTEMSLVVCDSAAKVSALVEAKDTCASLKVIVCVQSVDAQLSEKVKKAGLELRTFSDMVASGGRKLRDAVPPSPDDLCTICYTSGTTGNPKGVMLTHENLIANTASVLVQVPEFEMLATDVHISYLPLAHMFERIIQISVVPREDIHISYLPLAHMFERIVQNMVYQHGAQVGFFRGDVKLLIEDLQALKPTIFPTVPRLLNRIYDKVMLGVKSSKLKTFLFNMAMSSKMKQLEKGIISNDTLWDKLVFKKIQASLGGRVKIVVTGSAPLAENVLNFARCAFGCQFFEGYGQTECTAGLTFTLVNEFRSGHVGAPLPCNLVKLVDVPDMEYYAKNGKGEVCCKGTNVMKGYYKDKVKTDEAIDADGWLHTGDIGEWLPSGALKIIDRKKHLFKLAQGEYLAPEKIEGIYTRSDFVAQAFVDGSSLETFAVGVFVPDPDYVPGWASKQGLGDKSMEELCEGKELRDAILSDVTRIGKEARLKSFEQVKDLHLCPELFSVENGLLTPTFKSKRPVLRKHFSAQVTAMYARAK